EPQLELELALLARLSVGRDARRAARTRDEARVPAPANTAARGDDLRAVRHEVGDLFTSRDVAHGRACRHAHDDVASRLAALVLTLARRAVGRRVLDLELEVAERRELR